MSLSTLVRVTAVFLALSFSMPCAAAVLQVNSSGQLTGATGVKVNGSLYDVTFASGTCASVYGACDAAHLAFSNSTDAGVAAQALLDQVFVDGPTGQFDTDPLLTAACPNVWTYCVAIIPFGTGTGFNIPQGLYSTLLASIAVNNPAGNTPDFIVADDAFLLSFNSVGSNGFFARFTAAADAVPEPSTWAMMLLGFGAIGVAMRRRNGGAALKNGRTHA